MTKLVSIKPNPETDEDQDALAAQLAAASQHLTAIRVQENAAAEDIENLTEKRRALARSRFEQAMRNAEQVEVECARVRFVLEIDYDRINAARFSFIFRYKSLHRL